MHTKFAQAIMGIKTASFSPERLETFAKIASKRFIEENVPLNDSVAKIAQENDLNSHSVERVCEMANLQTHAALLPTEPEKRASFAFPLADAKKVASCLAPCPSHGSKMVSDFARPPRGPAAGGGRSMADLFGVSGQAHDGFQIPEKKKIIVMIQKKASQRSRMRDQMLKEAMLCETAELGVHKAVKQSVMQGDTLEDIHDYACHAGLGDLSAETLSKTASLLNQQFLISDEALEKIAFEAREELIDRNVPVRVINGRNPIIASLDALKKYRDNCYTIRDGLMGLEQDIEILKQRLKELE
jgi:hypothetical protein